MAMITNRAKCWMHSSTRCKENRVASNDWRLGDVIAVVHTYASCKRRDCSCSICCAIAHVEIGVWRINDKIHLVTKSGKSGHGMDIAEA